MQSVQKKSILQLFYEYGNRQTSGEFDAPTLEETESVEV